MTNKFIFKYKCKCGNNCTGIVSSNNKYIEQTHHMCNKCKKITTMVIKLKTK